MCCVASSATAGQGLLRLVDDGVFSGVQVILAQELATLDAEVPGFRAACAARGWSVAVAPSLPTRKGGKTAGVAVLASAHLGMAIPPGAEALDGRCVVAELSTRMLGTILVGSVYGLVGAEAATRRLLLSRLEAMTQSGKP